MRTTRGSSFSLLICKGRIDRLFAGMRRVYERWEVSDAFCRNVKGIGLWREEEFFAGMQRTFGEPAMVFCAGILK